MTVSIAHSGELFPLHSSVVCSDCMDDSLDSLLERSNWMKSEKNRLDTYLNWPPFSSQSPYKLAEAGFYYTGTGDRVECPFCFGVLKKWRSTDDPMTEHRTHFPYCKFIKGDYVGNIPMASERTSVSTSHQSVSENTESQGAVNCLDLTKEENRLRTFSRWPPNLTQTPEVLARAGFYHIPGENREDRVKCAYCKGKVYNWEHGDDPWIEHARCFPNCPYMKLCIGGDVVAELQRKQNEVCEGTSETNSASCTKQQETRNNITDLMRTEATQAVVEMGFSPDLVKRAVEKHQKGNNIQCLSGEELASIVLEMEEEEIEKSRNNDQQSALNLKTTAHTISKNTEYQAANFGSKNVKQGAECSSISEIKSFHGNSDMKASLRKENSELKDKYLCKVCFENQVRVTFMPCGHLACCGPCSMAVSECPICRSPITGCVRTYF